MNQLRLRLANWLTPSDHVVVPRWLLREYTDMKKSKNLASNLAGRVVEADGPDPQWKPKQSGVIMQEPDIVRAERERDEAL